MVLRHVASCAERKLHAGCPTNVLLSEGTSCHKFPCPAAPAEEAAEAASEGEEEEEEEEEGEEDFCHLCGQSDEGDILLLCDSCGKSRPGSGRLERPTWGGAGGLVDLVRSMPCLLPWHRWLNVSHSCSPTMLQTTPATCRAATRR